MAQCPGIPSAPSCACDKVQVILQARLLQCNLISLFERPLTADKKRGGYQTTALGGHCHFPTDDTIPFSMDYRFLYQHFI